MNLIDKPRILILEDSLVLREDLMERVKSLLDCVLLQAASSAEAIDHGRIDIALCDIQLESEQATGIDVAEALNQKRHVPIIYITRIQQDSGIEERIMNGGFYTQFLSKPISNAELRLALNSALNQVNKTYKERPSLNSTQPLQGYVLLRNGNGIHNLHIESEIVLLRADGEYTQVYTSTNTKHPIVVSVHLKELIKKISRHSAVIARASRFEAINIRKVTKIEDSKRSLSNFKYLVVSELEEKIKLSSNYKKEFLSRFNSL